MCWYSIKKAFNSLDDKINELCDIFGMKQMAKNSVQYELNYIRPGDLGFQMSERHALQVGTQF